MSSTLSLTLPGLNGSLAVAVPPGLPEPDLIRRREGLELAVPLHVEAGVELEGLDTGHAETIRRCFVGVREIGPTACG